VVSVTAIYPKAKVLQTQLHIVHLHGAGVPHLPQSPFLPLLCEWCVRRCYFLCLDSKIISFVYYS
jgi:hypothetical protein